MLISGIIASTYSLKNDKINGKSFKCPKYVFDGYQRTFDWASNQLLKKQMKLEQWHLKMIEKSYKKMEMQVLMDVEWDKNKDKNIKKIFTRSETDIYISNLIK